MAYVTPGTVAAGDVATAAAWNVIVNDILQFAPMVQGVFTNEAARDAAITAPTEGMHAYLTAPTVPAATGVNTFIPSGVQTIYNGSVWVCATEVGAYTSTQGSTTSNSYTATLSSGGTNPSVTLVTGTTAMLSICAEILGDATTNQSVYMSVAVSGAGTVAASDQWACKVTTANPAYFTATPGRSSVITGLTAGTNTFTLQYKYGGASNTGFFQLRSLVVKGIA